MSRYAPAILGVLVIVGLTIPQVMMSDRFADSNVIADQQAELLKNVPMKFGDWAGEDEEVTSEVRRVAGAVGAIQRVYRNKRSRDEVRLWLIVGHARPVSAHTPNICYAGSGFIQRASENSLYPFAFPGQPEAPFWTNTFTKEDTTGRQFVRVFWSWYNPMDENAKSGRVEWQASKNPRWEFGNTRALFKMYFTNYMRDPKETTEESPCSRFARDFLPIVNQALSQAPKKAQDVVVDEAPATASEGVSLEAIEGATNTETEPAKSGEAAKSDEAAKAEASETQK
jgi:Protein of unknown function (DUF3485)